MHGHTGWPPQPRLHFTGDHSSEGKNEVEDRHAQQDQHTRAYLPRKCAGSTCQNCFAECDSPNHLNPEKVLFCGDTRNLSFRGRSSLLAPVPKIVGPATTSPCQV